MQDVWVILITSIPWMLTGDYLLIGFWIWLYFRTVGIVDLAPYGGTVPEGSVAGVAYLILVAVWMWRYIIRGLDDDGLMIRGGR